MTTHELARRLLEMEDVPVFTGVIPFELDKEWAYKECVCTRLSLMKQKGS